jgi:hypothetical protein
MWQKLAFWKSRAEPLVQTLEMSELSWAKGSKLRKDRAELSRSSSKLLARALLEAERLDPLCLGTVFLWSSLGPMFLQSSLGTVFLPNSLGTMFLPSSLGTEIKRTYLVLIWSLVPDIQIQETRDQCILATKCSLVRKIHVRYTARKVVRLYFNWKQPGDREEADRMILIFFCKSLCLIYMKHNLFVLPILGSWKASNYITIRSS